MAPIARSFGNRDETIHNTTGRNREVVKTIGKLGIIATCACVLASGLSARASGAQLGNMQADKILFLGNSITFCSQVESPSWTDWWGLSASTPDKDYAHLLTQRINTTTGGSLTLVPSNPQQGDGIVGNRWYPSYGLPNYNGNILNMADIFERNYDTWTNARIQNQIDYQADIVVLQIGENMEGGTLDQFTTALGNMLTAFKESSNPYIFVTSYIMAEPDGVDAIKRNFCNADLTDRLFFVDLSGVLKETDPVSGQLLNVGAHSHPNDAGMAVIADKLYAAMVPEPSSIALSFTALVAMFWYVWKKRKQ